MAISSDKETLSSLSVVAVPEFLARLAGSLRRCWSLLQRWRDRTAAVRQLTRLDDRMLKDIGLSRDELASLMEAWQAGRTEAPRCSD